MTRAESAKRYRQNHPEKIAAYRLLYNSRRRSLRAENPEQIRAQDRLKRNRDKENPRQRARYAANPGKHRKYSLKKVYWTVEAYHQKKEEQNRRCALCGVPESSLKRALGGDHNHLTLEPRGLLCGLCNTALERLDNIPGWAQKAVEYLQRYEYGVLQNRTPINRTVRIVPPSRLPRQ